MRGGGFFGGLPSNVPRLLPAGTSFVGGWILFRRGGDHLRFFAGIVIVLIGIITYIYPEISYKRAMTSDWIPSTRPTYEIKTIYVPKTASAALTILGALMLFNVLKFKKRGAK